MKDPYLIENHAYLNDLQRLAASTSTRPYRNDCGKELKRQLRGMLAVAVIVAIIAFAPWDMFPMSVAPR